MTGPHDLLVIGAGPAGSEAALAAASAGLSVALIDEGPAAGGQVWRAPRTEAARKSRIPDTDRDRGDDLRTRLARSTVEVFNATQAWDAQPGFCVSCVSDTGARKFHAERLVLATGAIERIRPFEGWTMPGIFGLAAATAVMKSEKTLFGDDIVISGQGPLLIAVAAKACALGLRPRAVVDRASRFDWLRETPGFAQVPSMLATGGGWMARLALAGVPYFRRSEVIRAGGAEVLRSLTIRNLDTGATHEMDADTLYIGNGLTPADELHRLLGAVQTADRLRGGYRTSRDERCRSSVPGLYVAGDGAGVYGALPSAMQGRIAGLAAARDHGTLSETQFAARVQEPRRKLRRYEKFGDASCRLMQFPEDVSLSVTADTVICRCEDVTRADLDTAIDDGAKDLNQLKHFTRLGMGPCQGRMCSLTAAVLLRARGVGSETDMRLTPRAPVRPVEMNQLTGDFDYDDIPVPKPAPL
ncbi:FAD-dependent oxidoreductase [Roseovarius sp.]|uniref:FAD-dependent oxidoreductase n=1 Tax=Roseovarius sp. TaxID=1486281 RepID=UPI003565AD12